MRFKTSSIAFCHLDVGIVVRKPLKTWMTVCTVCRKTPRNGDQPSKQIHQPSTNRILGTLWACGRSPAEIVGSNPSGGMDICLL